MRFIGICGNRFIYFDEGMWLNHNRPLVDLISRAAPLSVLEIFKALRLFFLFSLETAKPVWSFISSLRIFFTGVEGWYFVRLVSAICGCLTVGMIWLIVKRLYNSVPLAYLSAAFLAVLPSHLYYSQLGLQEAFSAFFFLTGIYLYVRKADMNWLQIILSSFCFALVFLSNYRMIVSPLFILLAEFILSRGRKINFQKCIWQIVIFLLFAIGVSVFNAGKSLYVSFGWIFHQTNLAEGHFEWLNFLSYPYFIFSLETFIFGILFFGSIVFIFQKDWIKFFPTAVVFLQMILFSFSQEKAARFLCVVLPFMAIGAALTVNFVFDQIKKTGLQKIFIALVVLMIVQQLVEDIKIVQFSTDYEKAMTDLKNKFGAVKILSTQNEIQTLFSSIPSDVGSVPLDHLKFLQAAQAGYQYLLIDPQAFVSLTESRRRFTFPLAGYLGFIEKAVPPVEVYSHFSPSLLKRFVFDHNESLSQSIQFLRQNKDGRLGALKVYDMKICVQSINQFLNSNQSHK